MTFGILALILSGVALGWTLHEWWDERKDDA